jgi:hypothetical protein
MYTKPSKLNSRPWKLIAWTFLAALFLCSVLVNARQTNYKLCFPNSGWFSATPPDINQDIRTDSGWSHAFRYAPTSGGVVIRGITDGSNIYLSVDASGLNSLGGNATASLVALAFDPDGTSAHMQRIFVYPVNSGATTSSTPQIVQSTQYWRAGLSGSGVIPSPTQPPAWLGQTAASTMRVTYRQDSTTGLFSWSLAMKIPIANVANSGTTATNLDKVQVPSAGNFGLYMDVFRVISNAYQQTSWPDNAPEAGCPSGTAVGSCVPDSPAQTPASTNWGTATLDSACGGVSITYGTTGQENIFSNQNPTSKIALNAANTFGAYIQNTTVDASSGTAVDTAAPVKATFKIANWGMPSSFASWGLVTTDGTVATNPATKSIDGSLCKGANNNNNSACIVNIGAWTLTGNVNTPGTETNLYANTNSAHQCIQVTLEPAPASNTVVINRLAQRNFDFGNASKFERTAEINAKGYPTRLNPDGNPEPDQLFDVRITLKREVLQGGKTASANKSLKGLGGWAFPSVVSRITWIAEGCRHTGRYMTIKDRKLELCDSVGMFGYVVTHTDIEPVNQWNLKFTGLGMEKVPGADNLYQVHIPYNGVATVDTTLEPKSHKFAAFLDLGSAIPQGVFGNAFNKGFTLNGGLEYLINSFVSVEGVAGYHHFPAKAGNSLNIYQLSVDAKIYLEPESLRVRPFVNLGPGLYKFSPGPAKLGGNVGAGILFQFTPRFGLQGAYNFHVVNNGGATEFHTVQGGIRFVF